MWFSVDLSVLVNEAAEALNGNDCSMSATVKACSSQDNDPRRWITISEIAEKKPEKNSGFDGI